MMAVARRLPVVVVLGSTGTGKSKLGIELGQRFNGEIISADSMQLYKALDIITAKVTAEEQAQCPHHLLSVLDPLSANNTVVDFKNMALPIIEKLLDENKIPIIVGGTNYYIEALLWNFLIDEKTAKLAKSAGVTGDSSVPEASPQAVGDSKASGARAESLTEDSDSTSSEDDVDSDHGKGKENVSEKQSSKARQEKEGKYAGFDSAQLHDLLQKVDPASAKRLHPKNRRKVVRAVQVYDSYGVPMSQIHQAQHSQGNTPGLSGALRFPHCCVFWLRSQEEVLDKRLDRRVDSMLDSGLVSELHSLHAHYLDSVAAQNGEPDYTLGIFQSIGFKEFHEYLILPVEQRDTPEGKALFEKGVEGLKLATRQYARRQLKWVKNRFVKRAGIHVPPVYSLDSTDPSQWDSVVLQPATDILTAVIEGTKVPVAPLSADEIPGTVYVHNVCEVCDGRVFTTLQEWQAHLGSRKHKKMQQHKRNKEKAEQQKQQPPEPVESGSNSSSNSNSSNR